LSLEQFDNLEFIMTTSVSRRDALRSLVGGGAAAAVALGISSRSGSAAEVAPAQLKGRINHSVCRWCYGKIPLEDLCKAAKAMGIRSIDLMGPNEWPTLKKYDLTCAMATGAGMGIDKGFNRVELHDKLVEGFEDLIPKAANAGLENVICMSGNRAGLDDEQGLVNCAKGVKRLMKLAEEKKVNVVMELLNSKVDHKDYQCDHTAWGVELCHRVGSERFKLLYDIYHMQIMEGDLIATIRKSIECIAHFHTGGVPGRNEIDETQEINYPAVMRAIAATGFKGFVAQEFIPKNADALESLRRSVLICDV
jgi:hydroxypyruvate isomerase